MTQATTTTESYTYDAVDNRLSSLGVSPYNINTSNELTSIPGTTYTYDNNGNMHTKVVGSNTTTYAWAFENRMSSVTLPGSGGTVSFKYDPFGRRIYKSSSSSTSIYAYDGDNLIEETNSSGAAVARYSQTQNIDEPLAMLRSAATSYFHADGLGSVTSLSNSAGSIANTYTYDSYGNLTASTGSLVNPFQYTARESDSETGLYYYRARYYDSNAGRLLSEDPIMFQGGNNFYAYVHNTPTTFADPLGLLAIDPSCNCSAGMNGKDLQFAEQLAAAGASRITDPKLRDCILGKLNNTGVVKCGGSKCDKGSEPDKQGKVLFGWAPPFGNTIHLCKAAAGNDFSLACTMIHELAHTCGHPREGTPNRAASQAFPGVCK